jgi:hypothetical protein
VNHKDYKCEKCGATGVKLWRSYGDVWVRLSCAPCLGVVVGKTGLYGPRGKRTDQIKQRVPAVPTQSGDGFFGYTSVPDEAVAWWRALPSSPQRQGESQPSTKTK